MITGLYVGFAALFLIYLSARVIRLRFGKKVSVGTGGNADVERAMRVQANFVEYVPLALLLLAITEMNGFSTIAIHGLGIGLLVARLSHFIGFSRAEGPMIFRVAGTVLTFALLVFMAGVVVGQYFGYLSSS